MEKKKDWQPSQKHFNCGLNEECSLIIFANMFLKEGQINSVLILSLYKEVTDWFLSTFKNISNTR